MVWCVNTMQKTLSGVAGMKTSCLPVFRCRALALGVAVAAVVSLSGCAVGPDFKRPEAPKAKAYSPATLPTQTASALGEVGAAQHFNTGDISAQWWTLFQSPQLNALIKKAFEANPSIVSAQAALKQAQENVAAQRGFFFPTVQAGYSPARIKVSGNTSGNAPGIQGDGQLIAAYAGTPADQGGTAPFNAPVIYDFQTAQMTVGFVPDVFGGNMRQVESLQAQAQILRFQYEATYITLASNIVAAAIQEASLRAQIEATHKIIEDNTKSLEILRREMALGYVMRLDVAAQESALAQAELLLPPLEKQLDLTRDLIRALVGNMPDEEIQETFDLSALHLPEELPVSLPSQLVEQRPDVRAAEEAMHSASAQVGVAVAARLPQFSINATAGGNAAHFKEMFWKSGKFFSVVGNVSVPLFTGGTLIHRQHAAEQGLAMAEAQYRSTVITAFQNVADTLHALHADAKALQAAVRANDAAKVTLDVTRRQLQLGAVNYQALLSAEQTYQQAEIALVQAKASRLGDSAALFQALGGGWWHRMEVVAENKATAGEKK